MFTELRDHVIVLTGASSGIGRATALELASCGATLVLTSRDAAALEELARMCERRGGRALPIPADVTNEDEVEAVAQLAITRFGRFDVWVNNAAVALFARFEDAPSDVYRRVIETNLFGYIHGARAAMRQFKKEHRGILINIDSVTAGAPQPFTSAYVSSKFAIRGLSACIRMELILEHEDDIHVCNVMPAAIDTPLFQHAANYTGRAVKALDPVYPPEKVARAIASLIAKPRPEVVVGKAGNLMMAQARMSPRIYERVAARQIDRNHFQNDRPAPKTKGNLFVSMGPKSAIGGWRKAGTITAKVRRRKWVGALGAAGVLAAVALVAGRKRM